MTLSAQDLERFAVEQEVTIETRDGDRSIGTVIWVVEDGGTLFIRSFLGDRGRWYRRALKHPEVTLVAGDVRADFRAVPATDDESVGRATNGFLQKYSPGGSRDAMVASEVLHTTMRLDPV